MSPRDVKDVAAALWATFTESEKHGVRFGMFPGEKMAAAEQDLEPRQRRQLAVALMDCATKDGGMRG